MRQICKLVAVIAIIVTCIVMSGCGEKEEQEAKVQDLEFTVVRESEIPQELMQHIESKKENEFKCTFYNKDKMDYLYIVVGYGKQATGGYSVAVESLYLTQNSIYIDTSLIGPAKGDVVTQAITYPYVVVKIEYRDKPVTFI